MSANYRFAFIVISNAGELFGEYQKCIIQEGKPFLKETLRLKWHCKGQHSQTLVEVFKYHNAQLKALIGKDCSKATFGKYRTTFDHMISFLKWKFQRED